jgi:tetratricopeptide (TPR) repeat protein
VERSIDAVAALDPVAGCGDAAALSRGARPPSEASRAAVTKVREELAQARAERDTGKVKQARARIALALEHARQSGWRPLVAVALYENGFAEQVGADFEKAFALLHEGLWLALAEGDDPVAARCAVEILRIRGTNNPNPAEVARWLAAAQALLTRAGSPEPLVVYFERAAGEALLSLRDFEPARGHFQRSLESARRERDPIGESAALRGLANVAIELGENGAAAEHLARALAISEARYGRDSLRNAAPLEELGRLLIEDDKPAESLAAFERAQAIVAPALGKEHPMMAQLARGLAMAHARLGLHEEALAEASRSAELFARTSGPASGFVRSSLVVKADVLRRMKRYPESLAVAREAATMGSGDDRVDPLQTIGRDYLAMGEPKKAIPPLLECVKLVEEVGRHDAASAEVRFDLARQLWDAGADHALARRLATEALGDLGPSKDGVKTRERVQSWLAAHPGSPG